MKVTPIETNGRCGPEVAGFLPEKLEQDHQFRSEDLQEQNNEREAQERASSAHKKSANASSAKSDNPSLATKAGSDLGFIDAKTVK